MPQSSFSKGLRNGQLINDTRLRAPVRAESCLLDWQLLGTPDTSACPRSPPPFSSVEASKLGKMIPHLSWMNSVPSKIIKLHHFNPRIEQARVISRLQASAQRSATYMSIGLSVLAASLCLVYSHYFCKLHDPHLTPGRIVVWMWKSPQMIFHLSLDIAIVASSLGSLYRPSRLLLNGVSGLVLFVVTWDFFALLVPAMAWQAAEAPARLILLFDMLCMVYLAASLYARQSQEETRREVESLQRSQYNLAAA